MGKSESLRDREERVNSRQRFCAACRSEKIDRPPVWLMRQAGRYLPEYAQLRASHSFWEMVRTPSLAAEVTLQPIRRFGMDAAILFSDILIALAALGIKIKYEDGGPSISPRTRSVADLHALREVDPYQAFDYVGEAVERVRQELHPQTAVIGFAGAPFTLAAYLVAGGPSKDVYELKVLASREPRLYTDLAGRIAEVVAGLLRLQARAGVDALQIFDTWSLHLSPEDYAELALPYTARVIASLADLKVPIILYVRNAAGHLGAAAGSGCQVLSVDGSIRLTEARARLASNIALQGNFDPALLAAPAERIRARVREAIAALDGTGYIVNLGQGVMPETPLEGVAAFVNAVREEAT